MPFKRLDLHLVIGLNRSAVSVVIEQDSMPTIYNSTQKKSLDTYIALFPRRES